MASQTMGAKHARTTRSQQWNQVDLQIGNTYIHFETCSPCTHQGVASAYCFNCEIMLGVCHKKTITRLRGTVPQQTLRPHHQVGINSQ